MYLAKADKRRLLQTAVQSLLQCFERSSLKTDSVRPGQAKLDQGFYNDTQAGFYTALSLEQIQQYIDLYRMLVKSGSAEVRDAGVPTGKKRAINCGRKVRDNG